MALILTLEFAFGNRNALVCVGPVLESNVYFIVGVKF
jgi:hypothetical protein